jgi:hypothetical protein
MMSKNLLFLYVLNLLSFPVLANGLHSHEGEHSGASPAIHSQPTLSAQLVPALTGLPGTGSVTVDAHAHHEQPKTSLNAAISLPLGANGLNTDALSSVESLTVFLTNPDASLNCTLPLAAIGFTPIAGATGYSANARFELHLIRQAGQAPIYLAGSCTSVPDTFSPSNSLIATVYSGKTLLATLTGSLK